MTTAINDSTTRIKALEDHNTKTCTFLDSLNSRFEAQHQAITQQHNDIKKLWEAHNAQNQLVTALQQTQLQQGRTMDQMSTVQNSLVSKVDQLVTLAQRSSQNAENRMAAGQSHD